jgi:hypothetical protein
MVDATAQIRPQSVSGPIPVKHWGDTTPDTGTHCLCILLYSIVITYNVLRMVYFICSITETITTPPSVCIYYMCGHIGIRYIENNRVVKKFTRSKYFPGPKEIPNPVQGNKDSVFVDSYILALQYVYQRVSVVPYHHIGAII